MLFKEYQGTIFDESEEIKDKDIKDAEKMAKDSKEDISTDESYEMEEDIFAEKCATKEGDCSTEDDDETVEEKCATKEGKCASKECDCPTSGDKVFKEKKVCKEEDDEVDDDEEVEVSDDDVEDVEESLIVDDEAFELYESVCGPFVRNADNPALPAIHSFERWKLVEYTPVQGRIKILNPSGIREECNSSAPIDDIDKYVDDRDSFFCSTTDEVDDIIDDKLTGEGSEEVVPDSVDRLGSNTDDFTVKDEEDEIDDEPEDFIDDEEDIFA